MLQSVLEALKPRVHTHTRTGQLLCRIIGHLIMYISQNSTLCNKAVGYWYVCLAACPALLSQNIGALSSVQCVLRLCVLCVSDVTVGQQLNLPRYLSLDLFAGPPVVSSSALSSALVWLLSDKCVVWGSVCACHLSVSLSRIRHLTENLGKRSQHILYKKKNHTLAHIPTHTHTSAHSVLRRTSSPIV